MQLPYSSTTPSPCPNLPDPTIPCMQTPGPDVTATMLSPPALTNNSDLNVSVGLRPPLVHELVEPRNSTNQYYIVTVGTQVGIFETWSIADICMKHVPGTSVKAQKSWSRAVAYYADALSRNAIQVRDALPPPLSSPGNTPSRPISILSAAPSLVGGALFQYAPFHITSSPTTPAPAPAPVAAPVARIRPLLMPKSKAVASAPKVMKAVATSIPSTAATRVRKRKAPGSQTMHRSINSGADMSNNGAYIVSRWLSPPLSIISGPTLVVKPGPRLEDIITIPNSSDEGAPPARPVYPGKKAKKNPKAVKISTAVRGSSGEHATPVPNDATPAAKVAMPALNVRLVKKAQEALNRVPIFTTTDAEHAFTAKLARDEKAKCAATLKRDANHRANARAFKLAIGLQHAAALANNTSGVSVSGLASGSGVASGSGLDSSSCPIDSFAHMDGKPQDAFDSQAHLDGKSLNTHMDGKTDDKYQFDDLQLSEGGEEELTRILANPLVPSPSKMRAMGTIRRLESKKYQM